MSRSLKSFGLQESVNLLERSGRRVVQVGVVSGLVRRNVLIRLRGREEPRCCRKLVGWVEAVSSIGIVADNCILAARNDEHRSREVIRWGDSIEERRKLTDGDSIFVVEISLGDMRAVAANTIDGVQAIHTASLVRLCEIAWVHTSKAWHDGVSREGKASGERDQTGDEVARVSGENESVHKIGVGSRYRISLDGSVAVANVLEKWLAGFMSLLCIHNHEVLQ